jgi:hypothetical protein
VVTVILVIIVLEIVVDLEEVAVVNSLDQVQVEDGLEVVLQDSGHLTLLMVVAVVHIILEPMHRISKVLIHHLRVVNIVVTDTLKLLRIKLWHSFMMVLSGEEILPTIHLLVKN